MSVRSRRSQRHWRLGVGVLLSVVACGLMAKGIDVARTVTLLGRANYAWLVPNVVVTILAMTVRAHRWRALLEERVSAWRAFHVGNAGDFLNNVLPMRLGEVARAYLLGRNGDVSAMQALSTIAVERLLDVLTVFGFLLAVLPFVPGDRIFIRAGAVTAAIAFAGVLVLFAAASRRESLVARAHGILAWVPGRVRDPTLRHVDEFLRGVHAIGARRFVVCVSWSIVEWASWVGADWMLLFAFDTNATWSMGVFVTCAIALGLAIPSAPSGAGIYEAAAVAALALFGVPGDTALAYGLVLHLSNFGVAVLTGVWGLHTEGQTLAGIATEARKLQPAA